MNILKSYNTWKGVRKTRNELNALSNRELNDLGISRGDIHFIATRTVCN